MWVSSSVKLVSKHKTKNGLIRHHNAKHVVTEINNIESTQCSTSTPIDEIKTVLITAGHDNLTELLKEIQEDLSVNECVTPELRGNFFDTESQLLLAIKKIQEKYIKKCNTDEYFPVFYSDIVISCSSYFKGLRQTHQLPQAAFKFFKELKKIKR